MTNYVVHKSGDVLNTNNSVLFHQTSHAIDEGLLGYLEAGYDDRDTIVLNL
jgi:hypothetical protein